MHMRKPRARSRQQFPTRGPEQAPQRAKPEISHPIGQNACHPRIRQPLPLVQTLPLAPVPTMQTRPQGRRPGQIRLLHPQGGNPLPSQRLRFPHLHKTPGFPPEHSPRSRAHPWLPLRPALNHRDLLLRLRPIHPLRPRRQGHRLQGAIHILKQAPHPPPPPMQSRNPRRRNLLRIGQLESLPAPAEDRSIPRRHPQAPPAIHPQGRHPPPRTGGVRRKFPPLHPPLAPPVHPPGPRTHPQGALPILHHRRRARIPQSVPRIQHFHPPLPQAEQAIHRRGNPHIALPILAILRHRRAFLRRATVHRHLRPVRIPHPQLPLLRSPPGPSPPVHQPRRIIVLENPARPPPLLPVRLQTRRHLRRHLRQSLRLAGRIHPPDLLRQSHIHPPRRSACLPFHHLRHPVSPRPHPVRDHLPDPVRRHPHQTAPMAGKPHHPARSRKQTPRPQALPRDPGRKHHRLKLQTVEPSDPLGRRHPQEPVARLHQRTQHTPRQTVLRPPVPHRKPTRLRPKRPATHQPASRPSYPKHRP